MQITRAMVIPRCFWCDDYSFKPCGSKPFKQKRRLFYVEHRKLDQTLHLVLLVCAFLSLSACDRPLSEPELSDPIYLDMQKGVKEWERATIDFEKKLADNRQELAGMNTKDPMRHRVRAEIHEQERTLLKMKEK